MAFPTPLTVTPCQGSVGGPLWLLIKHLANLEIPAGQHTPTSPTRAGGQNRQGRFWALAKPRPSLHCSQALLGTRFLRQMSYLLS